MPSLAPSHRRPWHSWRNAALVALLPAALTLTSCSSPEPRLPQWPDVPNSRLNLPVGAEYVDPSALPLHASETLPPLGSLKPDDATPRQRVPEIIKRGRLIVGVAQSLNRLGFRDPTTGSLVGFEIDLAREIARDIFGDPERIDFRYVESRTREQALAEGDVDLIIRTMSITRERQKTVEFSIPYLMVHPRLLVLEGSDTSATNLSKKIVCVAKDSTSARQLNLANTARVLLTWTWTDCLMALQRQQADAIQTDDAILSGLHAQDPYTRLTNSNISQSSFYGVGMRKKGSAGLARQVNWTMERIRRDGTWSSLYNKWMADYLGPASASQLPTNYRAEGSNR